MFKRVLYYVDVNNVKTMRIEKKSTYILYSYLNQCYVKRLYCAILGRYIYSMFTLLQTACVHIYMSFAF